MATADQTPPALAVSTDQPTAAASTGTPGVVDAIWTCKLTKMDQRGQPAEALTEANPLTVGEKFLMSCGGPSVELDQNHLGLMLPKQAKYAIRILEQRSLTSDHGEFIATSWVGSTVEFKQLLMSDGKKTVDLGAVKLTMKSVVKPPAEGAPGEQQKKPEPFPPNGPVYLGLPVYVWIVATAILFVVLGWIGYFVARYLQKRRLKTLLAKNPIALSPFNYFNKELRRLSRGSVGDPGVYMKELNEAFRWFLTREFKISALDSPVKQVLKDVKEKNPLMTKPVSRDLSLALNEMQKALDLNQKLADQDLMQLTDLCRSLADRLNLQKDAGRLASAKGK